MSGFTKVLVVVVLVLSVFLTAMQVFLFGSRANYAQKYLDENQARLQADKDLAEKTAALEQETKDRNLLAAKLASLETTSQESITKLNEQVDKLDQDFKEQVAQVTKLTGLTGTQMALIEKLREENGGLVKDIAAAGVTNGELRDKIAGLDKTITARDDEIMQLKDTVVALKEARHKLDEEKAKVEQMLAYAKEELGVRFPPTLMKPVYAQVISVTDENDIIINKGSRDGVKRGYEFLVYNADAEERVLGTFIVTVAQERTAGGHLRYLTDAKTVQQGDFATNTIDIR
jgi:cell shape-determining protein MreC